MNIRDMLNLAYSVAAKLAYGCARRVGTAYGGGDYGDLHEAMSAANMAVAIILRDGLPADVNPVNYICARVRWAVMTEWNSCRRSRRGLVPFKDEHTVSTERSIRDRLTLASVASMMGYDAFAKILSADERVDALYLPNGMRLRCDPCQTRQRGLESRHIEEVRLALNLPQSAPLPRALPDIPVRWKPLTCTATTCQQQNVPGGEDITAPRHPNRGAAMALQILQIRDRCWAPTVTCGGVGDFAMPVSVTAATCDTTGFREVTDEQWVLIRPMLRTTTRHRTDPRAQINGIKWMLFFGAPISAVPSHYGCSNTVYDSYKRWRAGISWKDVARILGLANEMETRGMNKTASPRRPSRPSRPKPIAGRVRGLLAEAIAEVREVRS